MGTVVEIGLVLERAPTTIDRRAITEAFAEVDRIEQLISSWRADSVVGQINAAAGRHAVEMPEELAALLAVAVEAGRRSGGAFDVTFKPLARLWRIGRGRTAPPSDAEIARARALVDYHQLELDRAGRRAKLARLEMALDLGGIGKGYTVDRIVALLRRSHRDFYVQAGGDLFFAGRRGKRKWRGGIREPRGNAEDYFAYLELSDATLSTSGDYERFDVYGGKRYHHLIDPATGQPARGCRSVTIVTSSALSADWLSTAVFILGPQRGMALVESLPGVEAVIVSAENRVLTSTGLRGRLLGLRQPKSS